MATTHMTHTATHRAQQQIESRKELVLFGLSFVVFLVILSFLVGR